MNGPDKYPFDLSILGRALNYRRPRGQGLCKGEPFDNGGRLYLFLVWTEPDGGSAGLGPRVRR